MKPIGVALLDEYPLWVSALADLAGRDPSLRVDVTASSGEELVARWQERPCPIVIAEPWLRSDDGLDAIRTILGIDPAVTVIAFSRVWDNGHVQQLLDLGARAYVPKSTPIDQLPGIIGTARQGLMTAPMRAAGGSASGLTPREIEVLRLVSLGEGNDAIARALRITERTVKFHLQNAYRKLGARNRTEAAALARREGVI
jgi:DNA-binding NarL/FixJ family response regulator